MHGSRPLGPRPHRTARIGLAPICAVLVFAACSGTSDDTALVPTDAPPAITEASVRCDTDSARWSFAVTTDAWTGNGQVLLSTDGDYVERHTMYSTVAAADGTSDTLELSLSVVPDWRDVTLGSSTWFNCLEPALTGVVRVWTRDGADQADCRVFGEAPDRWAEWDAGASCATLLEPEG